MYVSQSVHNLTTTVETGKLLRSKNMLNASAKIAQ